MKTLNTKYAGRAVFLGISVDVSLPRVDSTVKKKGMTWPQLADGKGFDGAIARAYRVQGTPELFVVDGSGRLFARPASADQIEARLLEALARAPEK